MENNADLVEGNDIFWTAQICVPVKYCDSPLINRFGEVFHLAWLLSEDEDLGLATGIPPSETIENLGKKIKALDETIKKSSEEPACTAMEEIRAALFAPIASNQVGDNIEAIFDIGSGTIEGASYQLKRGESGKSKKGTSLDYFTAEVEPLGVDTISAYSGEYSANTSQGLVSNDTTLQKEIDTVAQSLLRPLNRGEFVTSKHRDQSGALKLSKEAVEARLQTKVSSQERVSLKLLLAIGDIHRLVGKVIVKPRRTKDNYRERLNNASRIDVLLSGGGSQVDLYQDAILSTYTAFNHEQAGIPKCFLNTLSLPSSSEDFSMSGIDKKYFYRFGVAYGLSVSEGDMGDFVSSLPSQINERREPPQEEPPLMDDW